MNVLYNAQSISLDLFHNLMKDMNQRHGVKTSGIYISDSRYYSDYVKKNQDLENYPTLKEWDVLKKGLSREPELTKLQELEKKYGDPNFWNVLIADRRLIFGRKLVFEQDYKSKYSHSQLLSILQTGFEEIEQLFDRLKPDCVIGFICVTLGEYISYLIAKDRGIPFINIRPTKIKSYMLGDENIYEPCLMIKPIYEDFLKNGVPKKYEREVDDYLSQARVEHAKHEGFIAPPKKKIENCYQAC